MPLRLMFDSDTMDVGFGLDLSKDLEMEEWQLDLVYTVSITECTMVGKVTLVLSWSTCACPLFLWLKGKCGKAYAGRRVQFIWSTSTIYACGSGCQFMYFWIWWYNLYASRSTSDGPKACISFLNISLFNIHSIDKFFISLVALSGLVFKVPSMFSSVNLI